MARNCHRLWSLPCSLALELNLLQLREEIPLISVAYLGSVFYTSETRYCYESHTCSEITCYIITTIITNVTRLFATAKIVKQSTLYFEVRMIRELLN